MFESVLKQLITQIDDIDYDLQSFIAGFVYGMHINKLIFNTCTDEVNKNIDALNKQIIDHYNFEVKNEDLSGGTV